MLSEKAAKLSTSRKKIWQCFGRKSTLGTGKFVGSTGGATDVTSPRAAILWYIVLHCLLGAGVLMPKQVVRVVAAVVERDGRYLITQRRETAVLPLQWEFPGGKVEATEKDETALQRELHERLDADFTIGRKIGEKHHTYDGYEVVLALYAATLVPPKPMRAKRVRDFRWVASSEFGQYQFPDADQRTMDQLLGIRR